MAGSAVMHTGCQQDPGVNLNSRPDKVHVECNITRQKHGRNHRNQDEDARDPIQYLMKTTLVAPST